MEFRASHILVKDQSKAEEIYNRVKNGESFSSLAHQYSTCPSKEKGGDLGWFPVRHGGDTSFQGRSKTKCDKSLYHEVFPLTTCGMPQAGCPEKEVGPGFEEA